MLPELQQNANNQATVMLISEFRRTLRSVQAIFGKLTPPLLSFVVGVTVISLGDTFTRYVFKTETVAGQTRERKRLEREKSTVSRRQSPSIRPSNVILKLLHGAEVYSDMNTEYIAIGFYGILLFFGSHPRFNLGSGDDVAREIHVVYPVAVVLQIGIELIVDFVASAIEIRLGVDFESFNENGPYLAIFMMVVSVTNIHISSGIYLHAQ
ncbi:hypothetical protein BBJ29_000821 [Phytophthora kernoviae]|uniref:Uncharacterized protein n=1 Tax=Phytophthora kernoviae TaxID=325452 RepID=A0A3F2S2R7_9STRA|nr:hypothetical protein BBJ29_000821 [Phytophthora kernoviae]RLN69104.1 hypothetical protein BBP00_00000537 [Phytophthora kernoviae]